jgi:N-acetylglucosaminyldiphosphoundecaprenol N-acetyl-beta-D-mannosaminyltransferase
MYDNTFHSVDILGVNVGTQTSHALLDYISATIDANERAIIAYINIHTINLSMRLPWFREYLNLASNTYCDGYGVKLAAWLLGYHIPERYTAPDWIPDLVKLCSKNDYTIFILGAKPGVAFNAARKLSNQARGVKIVETHHGYFNKTADSPENELIIEKINSHHADILILGLGTPLQEQWLMENWQRLNCRIALPVGAALDYLGGEAWRAPHWMTDNGFEWIGRLLSNPRRFWKRYIIGIPCFLYYVFLQRLGHPIRPGSSSHLPG